MKKLYWRPNRVSRVELFVIAVLSLSGLVAVENFPQVQRRKHYQEKTAAAELALEAMRELKGERQRRKIPINEGSDPGRTGMIGDLLSPIASNSGHLASKLSSVNPNFAAVMVHLLRQAGVRRGDLVAVGLSGSFPAINVATYAALEAMQVKPVVIASASASQFGATHPRFTWLDMESFLAKRHIFTSRSVAASLGGIDDRALGLSNVGKSMLAQAIERAGVERVEPESYEDSVERRMRIYAEHANGRSYRAYINVGGGTASVGTRVGKKLFRPGLNRSAPAGDVPDSVMFRFAQRGVPVIHMSSIIKIGTLFGLPTAPETMPVVGEGSVFETSQYNPWLTAGVLLAIVIITTLFLRLHLGMRLGSALAAPRKRSAPSEMV